MQSVHAQGPRPVTAASSSRYLRDVFVSFGQQFESSKKNDCDLEVGPFGGIVRGALLEKLRDRLRYFRAELHLGPVGDRYDDLWGRLPSERILTHHSLPQEHAQRVDVNFPSKPQQLLVEGEELGGHVTHSAQLGRQHRRTRALQYAGQAEVADLTFVPARRPRRLQQDVVAGEVAMHDAPRVEVVPGLADVNHHVGDLQQALHRAPRLVAILPQGALVAPLLHDPHLVIRKGIGQTNLHHGVVTIRIPFHGAMPHRAHEVRVQEVR
mmetsp:Transcript_21949/g.71082  ORF Transcript_21949/g.71082 Transcript_21949/m.71082 type:complete len:267 (+) Transcript_21949:1-801(+)